MWTRACCRYNLSPNTPDLGPGAAVHISDPAEPVGSWLKAAGSVHSHAVEEGSTVPSAALVAAREGRVTGR